MRTSRFIVQFSTSLTSHLTSCCMQSRVICAKLVSFYFFSIGIQILKIIRLHISHVPTSLTVVVQYSSNYRTDSIYLLCHIQTVRFIGNDFTSAQQLLESLWAYDEWKSEQHIESDADFVARADELRRHLSDSAVATQSATSSTSGEPASTSTQQTGARQDSACVVCMCVTRSVVLIPCGHLAVCNSCYVRLEQCPICRSVIRGSIRSYMA